MDPILGLTLIVVSVLAFMAFAGLVVFYFNDDSVEARRARKLNSFKSLIEYHSDELQRAISNYKTADSSEDVSYQLLSSRANLEQALAKVNAIKAKVEKNPALYSSAKSLIALSFEAQKLLTNNL